MSPPLSRTLLRAALATLFGFAWTSLFWIQPLRRHEPWKSACATIDVTLFEWFGVNGVWRWALKSWLFVLVPILLLWLLGVKPRALGMGRMVEQGWRIVALGFALAMPVLVWLGMRPGIHKYYERMFTIDGWSPVLANALVIVVEHAFIEGLLLALALPPGYRFEELPDDPPRRGRLAWLGLGNTAGGRGPFDWLGVPPVVLPALVGQALVFGAVHWGKEIGELVTAFPGGFGLGLLTYRIRSVWPSVLLHLGTGAIILTTAYLTFR